MEIGTSGVEWLYIKDPFTEKKHGTWVWVKTVKIYVGLIRHPRSPAYGEKAIELSEPHQLN